MSEQARSGRAPDRNHPIAIEPKGKRVVVSYAGKVVADTEDALTLREADYPPVLYIPRRDVDMSVFERTSRSSHCPYKGDCAYFTIAVDGKRSTDAAWTYEAPYADVIAIRDHLAFYRDRVDAIAEVAAGERAPS